MVPFMYDDLKNLAKSILKLSSKVLLTIAEMVLLTKILTC